MRVGDCCIRLQKTEEATQAFQNSIEISAKLNDEAGHELYVMAFDNMSKLYFATGKNDDAQKILEETLKICNTQRERRICWFTLARIYAYENQPNKSKEWLHFILDSFDKAPEKNKHKLEDIKDLMLCLSMLNQTYKKLNQPQEALVYSAKLAQMTQSLKQRGILPNSK